MSLCLCGCPFLFNPSLTGITGMEKEKDTLNVVGFFHLMFPNFFFGCHFFCHLEANWQNVSLPLFVVYSSSLY